MKKFWFLIGMIPLSLTAQEDSIRLPPAPLKQVEVKGTLIKSVDEKWAGHSMARNPLLNSTTENLNLSPGIFAGEGTSGTAKFSYRGLGARSQYTTSRSLLYFGDIPLTGGQGFSTFEDIDPFWVQSFALSDRKGEVYPTALGGVLVYNPLYMQPPDQEKQHQVRNEFMTGSFGLIRNHTAYSFHNGRSHVLAGYGTVHKNGWRENSTLDRQSVFTAVGFPAGDQKLQFLALGIKNRSEIPSSLSLEDFQDNPEEAAESWAETEGFEQYYKWISGVTWSGRSFQSGRIHHQLTVFYQFRDGFEPRPFNILEEQSHSGGFRGSITMDSLSVGDRRFKITAFSEFFSERNISETFENRFDSISQTHNHPGDLINSSVLLSNRIFGGINIASDLFESESHASVWRYEAGLSGYYRFNRTGADAGDRYDSPPVLAPRFKLYRVGKKGKYSITPSFQIYRSYAIPSLEENLDPDGSLNAGLKPEFAWNIELELDYYDQARNRISAALYYISVDNLIIPRLTGADMVVATNSGSSIHTGLEALYRKEYYDGKRQWYPEYSIGGYIGHFTYRHFSDTAGVYHGNRLPGFPDWQCNTSFQMNYRAGKALFSLGVLGRYTSGYYVNDQNTVETNPYFLLQLWFENEWILGEAKNWRLACRGGIKNLTDQRYAAMTVVNNQAFGGGSPRYYYPGEPLNGFASISLNYTF